MSKTTRPATLVVIEFSASWPSWLKPDQLNDMAVVAQHYEGAPSSLVTQVATRINRLRSLNWRVSEMILVSNGRIDADSNAARAVLARGLLARLRHQGRGRLTLTVDEKSGRRAFADVKRLSQSLERSLAGKPLSLVLRLGDDVWTSQMPESDSVVAENFGQTA